MSMTAKKISGPKIKKITAEEMLERELTTMPEMTEGTGERKGLKGLLELLGEFVVVGGDFV